jgi:uncharacterized protein YkwD
MASPRRAPGRRRLASLLLGLAALAALIAPATATATTVDAATISSLEKAMIAALNEDRTELGLVPVRADARLMAVARARSADMIAKDYFSHTQPDGRNVFDILTAQHITWYNAGEIIAWNNYPLDVTVSTANHQWMNSPGHKAIIVSPDLNYVGVGLAVDPVTGKKMWTAVYIKGPDRTPARASLARPAMGTGLTATSRRARFTWTGYDVRLQVLTAGLKSFTVQRRVDGGSWVTLWSATTANAGTITMTLGHRYEVRVSAVDKRGNRGAWSTKVVDLR